MIHAMLALLACCLRHEYQRQPAQQCDNPGCAGKRDAAAGNRRANYQPDCNKRRDKLSPIGQSKLGAKLGS